MIQRFGNTVCNILREETGCERIPSGCTVKDLCHGNRLAMATVCMRLIIALDWPEETPEESLAQLSVASLILLASFRQWGVESNRQEFAERMFHGLLGSLR